jgi:hypothetical protein
MDDKIIVHCDHKVDDRPCLECIDKAIKACANLAYLKGFTDGLKEAEQLGERRKSPIH